MGNFFILISFIAVLGVICILLYTIVLSILPEIKMDGEYQTILSDKIELGQPIVESYIKIIDVNDMDNQIIHKHPELKQLPVYVHGLTKNCVYVQTIPDDKGKTLDFCFNSEFFQFIYLSIPPKNV